LDISKIEAGKIDLHKKYVDIAFLAKEVGTSFKARVENRGMKIKTRLPEESTEVYVDRDKIIQVFTNLVGNSLKFTNEGHIELSVEDKEDRIECYVADTGMGISEERTHNRSARPRW